MWVAGELSIFVIEIWHETLSGLYGCHCVYYKCTHTSIVVCLCNLPRGDMHVTYKYMYLCKNSVYQALVLPSPSTKRLGTRLKYLAGVHEAITATIDERLSSRQFQRWEGYFPTTEVDRKRNFIIHKHSSNLYVHVHAAVSLIDLSSASFTEVYNHNISNLEGEGLVYETIISVQELG